MGPEPRDEGNFSTIAKEIAFFFFFSSPFNYLIIKTLSKLRCLLQVNKRSLPAEQTCAQELGSLKASFGAAQMLGFLKCCLRKALLRCSSSCCIALCVQTAAAPTALHGSAGTNLLPQHAALVPKAVRGHQVMFDIVMGMKE